jgi:hypothetical protein
MKLYSKSAIAVAVLAGGLLMHNTSVRPVSAQMSDSASPAKHESPFACDRMALNPEERKRHFDELGPQLRELRKGVRELSDGYEFEFPSDKKTYALLNEWAVGERYCCPFFDISIRADRESGPVWLRLTGREGTKQFIRADFPKPWFQQ